MKRIKCLLSIALMLIILMGLLQLPYAGAYETALPLEEPGYSLADYFAEKVYCKATLERWLCRRCCAYCYQQIRERD